MSAARSKSAGASTPLRKAFCPQSNLILHVMDGIKALKSDDRQHISDAITQEFSDSIDIDSALQNAHPQQNRWDYLLGHSPSVRVIAIEIHSAKDDEISAVIKKREAAQQQLKPHLANGAVISVWLWVSSGSVKFANTERARRRLDQHGIEFVGRKVLKKHLPK